MDEDDQTYRAGSEFDDADSTVQELEERIEALENRSDSSKDSAGAGYVLGMSIAVVLSWSRNASILWCILHGLLSWIYVIYFAFTRKG